MPLTNKDEHIVREVLNRVFRGFVNLMNEEDSQVQQVMNKCQEALLEIIQKELTQEEKFHYIQSCKHALEMSETRYNELNQKIYSTIVRELESIA